MKTNTAGYWVEGCEVGTYSRCSRPLHPHPLPLSHVLQAFLQQPPRGNGSPGLGGLGLPVRTCSCPSSLLPNPSRPGFRPSPTLLPSSPSARPPCYISGHFPNPSASHPCCYPLRKLAPSPTCSPLHSYLVPPSSIPHRGQRGHFKNELDPETALLKTLH